MLSAAKLEQVALVDNFSVVLRDVGAVSDEIRSIADHQDVALFDVLTLSMLFVYFLRYAMLRIDFHFPVGQIRCPDKRHRALTISEFPDLVSGSNRKEAVVNELSNRYKIVGSLQPTEALRCFWVVVTRGQHISG